MSQMGTVPLASRTGLEKHATLSAWLLTAIIVLVAALMRVQSLENADVSWLLTLAEKLLDGRHDFIEVNPPGAIFTYMPAVWLARLFGLRPELVCDALIFLAAGLSLGFILILLGQKFTRKHHMPLVMAGGAAILLLLPAHVFGEREHIGFIFILPWIAVLAARLGDTKPDLWMRICAGLACGLCVVIKPHFIANIALLSLVLACHMRTWRGLFVAENCAAALVLLIYGIILWVGFSDFFFETMPMVKAAYVPDRLSLSTLLLYPASLLWAATIALLILTRALWERYIYCDLLVVMSGVSFGTFLLQGKGWPYHSYPAIGFALLVLSIRFSQIEDMAAKPARFLRLMEVIATLIIFYIGVLWFDLRYPQDTRLIAAEINKIARQPTIGMIGGDISVGFPVTRLVQGSWAQRSVALWLTGSALKVMHQPEQDPKVIAAMNQYKLLDRSMLRDDIEHNRPEILLVEDKGPKTFDWLGWVRSDPQFAAVIDHYRFVTRVEEVQIWQLVSHVEVQPQIAP